MSVGGPAAGRPRRFALVAGEASGDLLGGPLIQALREHFPHAEFAGIGGERMQAAGLESWFPIERLSVMGLAEVLRHLPGLLALRRRLRQRVRAWQPDAFIGIDAPDFNLALERQLKRRGLATVHYVSPSVWAWREGRAAGMGRSADLVLCLFPMEPAIYAAHGVDARFVGHPLAGTFALEPDQAAARRTLGLDIGRPVLALLPGSRRSEIERLAPDFLAAARRLRDALPGLCILAPMATSATCARFEALARAAGLEPARWDGSPKPAAGLLLLERDPPGATPRSHLALLACDAVILASGTAALEAMLAKRPMVVGYRLSALSHRIVRAFGLLKVPHYSLPNVLAGRELVPERMQEACTPAALAAAVLPALQSRRADPALLDEYRRQHTGLLRDSSREAAAAIAGLVAAREAVPQP